MLAFPNSNLLINSFSSQRVNDEIQGGDHHDDEGSDNEIQGGDHHDDEGSDNESHRSDNVEGTDHHDDEGSYHESEGEGAYSSPKQREEREMRKTYLLFFYMIILKLLVTASIEKRRNENIKKQNEFLQNMGFKSQEVIDEEEKEKKKQKSAKRQENKQAREASKKLKEPARQIYASKTRNKVSILLILYANKVNIAYHSVLVSMFPIMITMFDNS